MPEPVSVARKKLGRALAELRGNRSHADVGKRIGKSRQTIDRIERGLSSIDVANLEKLLDLYEVDDDQRSELLALQSSGRHRGWWSEFGTFAPPYVGLLGYEDSASSISIYEPLVVPGLLHTEAYARAMGDLEPGDVAPDVLDRRIAVHLARQDRIFDGECAVGMVIDESVLYRVIGDRSVMRSQLLRLLDLPDECTLYMIEFDGPHHGAAVGRFCLFEFPPDVGPAIGYVDGVQGNLFIERAEDIDRCKLAYDRMTAVALSPAATRRHIRAVVKDRY